MRSTRRLACRSFSPFSLAPPASFAARVGCRDELFGVTRAWMASPSVGPPPDRLAVFYNLVDKQVIAAVLGRDARAMELTAAAATHAEALWSRACAWTAVLVTA